ncbi:hypothetical protein [Streptomyces sp. NPDC058206]|uniref:hypothetical protein n=1 Tax=Streptomyces sp. NPDC058206 TaxID=3346382 RepID=UPI0036E57E06
MGSRPVRTRIEAPLAEIDDKRGEFGTNKEARDRNGGPVRTTTAAPYGLRRRPRTDYDGGLLR